MNISKNIKKGDTVIVLSGKDRGKKGKVTRLSKVEDKVVVDGINQRIRHTRPKKQGQKGQKVTVTHPVWLSNVMIVCSKCGKGVRVGRSDGKRVCKKCGGNL
ncbi:MAG: 50S ribosomal protein L24 [bacterium]|nr:50S ribosomal protein L24 [bacterium]